MPDQIDAGTVKALYEGAWSNAREAVESEIAAGETSLSRLLHRSFANMRVKSVQTDGVSRIFGAEVAAPFLAAKRISRDWIADCVIAEAARIDADAVVELGSGFGYNLFNIWLRGGPNVDYHAYEFTEAGRETCAVLRAAAHERPRLSTHVFDYYAANLAAIAGRYLRPVIYSSHSIEQIRILPDTVIDAVLAVAPAISVIHFEPVGWQIDSGSDSSQRLRLHCEKHGYNENLWPMLQARQASGDLVIEEVAVNVMAPKIQNVSSLVRWRKA